jgi:flagellar hook-length control protein FliK
MTMDNLQVAAPASPATAVTNTAPAKPTEADARDAAETPPWVAAFKAALSQHAKGQKHATVPLPGVAKKDPGVPVETAPGAEDKRQDTADAKPAAVPVVLPLLATLPAIPPPPPATSAATTTAKETDEKRPEGDNVALVASPATPDADRRVAAQPRPVDAQQPAPIAAPATDATASPDAAMRALDHVSARDGDRRDVNASPQLQFSMAHAAPAAAPPPAPPAAQIQLETTLGSAGWGTELGQKVAFMIGEKQHVAELHVNPPDLGPLDIKLTITDNQTTAVFTSPHSAVRDAVESALPRLREVLAESGIMLGNASVTSDTPRDGSAFSTPQDQQQRGHFGAHASAAALAPAPNAAGTLIRRNGLVDLFA